MQQSHDKALNQLSDKLKLKDEQIESLKVQYDQSLQNQSLELKVWTLIVTKKSTNKPNTYNIELAYDTIV